MKRSPLKRKTPLRPTTLAKDEAKPTLDKQPWDKPRPKRNRSGISPASPAQRKKAHSEPCVVTGEKTLYGATIDPAHVVSRAQGGCDDPLCVVPLRRDIHRLYDEGRFDLLPHLVGRRVPELLHALEHFDGSPTRLLHRLTGERHVPVRIQHGDDLDTEGQ